ncbi:MAG: hypothetical protein ACRC18_06725 [Cetobacterium sp.]
MIRCIGNVGYECLTLGKEYEVNSWSDTRFYLYDDNGVMNLGGLPKSLFEYDVEIYDEI